MTDATVRTGFFPDVAADHVTVEQAYAATVLSADDVTLTRSGASVVAVAGSASISEGGAGIVLARDLTVRRGLVGLAVGRRITLEDSRVLLGTAQAAAAGAALAGVLLIGRILVRKR